MKALQSTPILPLLLTTIVAAGCAGYDSRPTAARSTSEASSRAASTAYGVVDAIEPARNEMPGVGAGAIIGGVVGGVLGNQVGEGRGNTAATIAGAVGGAAIGHQLEKRRAANLPIYHVRVRLDNGSYQTFAVPEVGELRAGDRVRIEDNHRLQRY